MSAKPEAVRAAIKKLRDRAGWWQGDKNAEAVLTELIELHTQPLVDAADRLAASLVERGAEANKLRERIEQLENRSRV